MIIVTGANGQLGRAVIENLLRTLPAAQVVASVRDPQQATALAERGVEVRKGDFADPAGLAHAFAGADQVLVVSPDKLGEQGIALSRNAITGAYAAGAHRVLYTSHMGTHDDSPFRDHAVVEEFLAASGRPFTSLRNGYYAESALFHIRHGLEAGEFRAPEDGPVSWTLRADLAEANAAVLAADGQLEGITPPLVAPESFTLAELAALASELSGRDIKRVVLTDEQWRQEQLVRGTPAPFVEVLLKSYRDMRRGVFASTDPTLGQLLGRRPATMRDVLMKLLLPVGDN